MELNTLFTIKVENCYDEDFPISYKYSYYSNYDLYQEDLTTATTLNINSLTDFINFN